MNAQAFVVGLVLILGGCSEASKQNVRDVLSEAKIKACRVATVAESAQEVFERTDPAILRDPAIVEAVTKAQAKAGTLPIEEVRRILCG